MVAGGGFYFVCVRWHVSNLRLIVFCSSSSSVGSPLTLPHAIMLRVIQSHVVALQACVYCLPSAGYQSGSARVGRP